MNWNSLIFGSYNRVQIRTAVDDSNWQKFRESLRGANLPNKYVQLLEWLMKRGYTEKSKVQVTNYVNALRRGGLIMSR